MTHIDEKRCNSCEMGWHDDCDTSGESFVCRCSVCAREAERIQGLIDSSERATASALDLEAIRQLARENRDEGMVNVDGGVRLLPKDAIAMNNALLALCDEVERLRVENAKLREIIDEDLSGRPLEFLLHEIADRLHYEGGGSMEDCVRDKEEKILAYRALADLALRSGGG